MAAAILSLLVFVLMVLLALQTAEINLLLAAVPGILATLLGIASLFFGFLQLRAKIKLRVRVLRIATFAASLALVSNLLFWEMFNFWSI